MVNFATQIDEKSKLYPEKNSCDRTAAVLLAGPVPSNVYADSEDEF